MALKQVPTEFDIDSEEEVRFAVAQYFTDLGFDPNELSFEDHFRIQLGRTRFRAENSYRSGESDVGLAHGYSDLLLSRNGIPLAVVEVKHIVHPLNIDDGWQAISYARLLRGRIAPYAIVTNGIDTKVYDPLADSDDLVEIDDPTNAIWAREGQSLTSINEDLRFQAARKLVGINSQTLDAFCKQQVDDEIDDLKGTVNENKIYIPDVYLHRELVSQKFHEWLTTGLPCFAVVGESGVGKTSFLCAIAESLSDDHFVLFYSAQNLVGGLSEAIANDFVWEFKRDRTIAHIAARIDELAELHEKLFIIFLDALDEFTGDLSTLKAEIRDLLKRIKGSSIRLCISCKSFDWNSFVIDSAQNFNRIAKLTFPQSPVVANPTPDQINSRQVGFWLNLFTEAELEMAFEKYRTAYSLQGELRGQARSECQMPLNLRLLAEVYQGADRELPDDLSTREVFELYWQRKLGKLSTPIPAQQILINLAEDLVLSGKRHIQFRDLAESFVWTDAADAAFRDTMRIGLVRAQDAGPGDLRLSFPFEKLRSYVFAVHSSGWTTSEPEAVAEEICALLNSPNQLRTEAVQFYLSQVDRGETSLLTEIAIADLNTFLLCIGDGFLSNELSSSLDQLNVEDRSKAFWNRVEQYAMAYSRITRHYFGEIATRIVPFTANDVGVWISEDGNAIQFRATTEKYPQPVMILEQDLVGELLGKQAPQRLLAELGNPAGTIHIGSSHRLLEQLPQKLAWDKATEQVATVLAKGLLDETPSASILQERIRRVLFDEPSMWFANHPDRSRNYEKLGLGSEEDAYSLPIGEIRQQIQAQLVECGRKALEFEKDKSRNWWLRQYRSFYLLGYWLSALQNHQEFLLPPPLTLEEVMKSIRNPQAAVSIIELLLPEIMASYQSIVEKNFPRLADRLALYQNRDGHLAVEITYNPSGSPWAGDFVEVRYILLPSVQLPSKHIVYACSGENSIGHTELILESAQGHLIRTTGPFGKASLSINVDGLQLEEPNAIVYRTKFPDRHPVASQVYQMVSAEMGEVLSAGWITWGKTESSSIDYTVLASVLARAKRRYPRLNADPG
jgi:hypothetical protein